jgi:hypothetical protein
VGKNPKLPSSTKKGKKGQQSSSAETVTPNSKTNTTTTPIKSALPLSNVPPKHAMEQSFTVSSFHAPRSKPSLRSGCYMLFLLSLSPSRLLSVLHLRSSLLKKTK